MSLVDNVLRYPRVIVLEDGTTVPMTGDDWKSRQLLIDIDRPESEVRDAFAREGFRNAGLEEKKDGQLGKGLRKEFDDWSEVHVRLFRRGKHILIDGELEVSSRYVEHLNRKWIPALEECVRIVSDHFAFRLYYAKARKYVSRASKYRSLSLQEPSTKTDVVTVVVTATVTAIAVSAILWAYKKSKRPS